jgi:hypothetical protein
MKSRSAYNCQRLSGGNPKHGLQAGKQRNDAPTHGGHKTRMCRSSYYRLTSCSIESANYYQHSSLKLCFTVDNLHFKPRAHPEDFDAYKLYDDMTTVLLKVRRDYHIATRVAPFTPFSYYMETGAATDSSSM